MQNLKLYCRQRIEALADKQWKFGCIYRVRFEHIIVHGENTYIEPLYIFFYNIKEMSEFCKSMKL